jgi:hypothetical protein
LNFPKGFLWGWPDRSVNCIVATLNLLSLVQLLQRRCTITHDQPMDQCLGIQTNLNVELMLAATKKL